MVCSGTHCTTEFRFVLVNHYVPLTASKVCVRKLPYFGGRYPSIKAFVYDI